ncbi:MAG: Gfo/Idh/MocA family oxidoreductase [Actinomycetes bacterium]
MPLSVMWAVGDLAAGDQSTVDAYQRQLLAAGWQNTLTTDAATPSAVLIWTRGGLDPSAQRAVEKALSTRTPVVLLGPTLGANMSELTEAAGIAPDRWSAPHPARIRAQDLTAWHDRVTPLGNPIEVHSPILATDKVLDAVDVLASAHLGLTTHPVVTWNSETSVGVFCLLIDAQRMDDAAAAARLLHLALRHFLDLDGSEVRPLQVGLLGFGAIGEEHARAAIALPGLELGVICDRSRQRLADAHSLFPGVRVIDNPDELLSDDEIDVIVVSTPPDSHADWAERVMNAGKDVIVEKPFALTVEESDRVLGAAERSGCRTVVYQNRRFDPDFLTILSLAQEGVLGEVFHLEAFIGGFGHPCNYWHSDESVSGGALYDWGSHLIDQILTIQPQPIDHVTCIEHNRKWHDVTNADHTSMSIRYRDGSEAVFIHSDLAAALKPRWYLLGTEGAITSSWRYETVVRRSAIGTLDEDVLAATDSPPELTFVDHTGSSTTLAQRTPERHAFHRQFVDDVRYGWPMTVAATQSRRVVAVMEAARASAREGGAPVQVNGEA